MIKVYAKIKLYFNISLLVSSKDKIKYFSTAAHLNRGAGISLACCLCSCVQDGQLEDGGILLEYDENVVGM